MCVRRAPLSYLISNNMSEEHSKPHDFDSKGFLFFIKFAICLVLAIGITHVTLGYLYPLGGTASQASNASQNLAASASQGEFKESKLKTALESIKERTDAVRRKILPKKIPEAVPSLGKFIAADLEKMQLLLYEDGVLVADYPILSKGKEGSRWETPTGYYSVKTKERSHFSSIGEVFMPFSMQFYGNFFIHGWPYYESGEQVPLSYSGGCVRLSTADAEKVFEFATVGTPMYVYDVTSTNIAVGSTTPASALGANTIDSVKDPQQGSNAVTAEPKPATEHTEAPNVSAEAYLIGELNGGEVILEKSGDTVYPMASISKLMTAIVSNDAMTYDRKIVITETVLDTLGDSGNLAAGEMFDATELLYPLLMESSNDAAAAYAATYGFDSFIKLLNNKAKALGMENTAYADSSGLSDGNVSTASDLFRLAQYLYYKQPFILAITRKPSYHISTTTYRNAHDFKNFNVFASWKNFIGGKTGRTTAAKETMLSIFKVKTSEGQDKLVAIIVMRSDDRAIDTKALYNWYVKNFGSEAVSS